MSCPNFEIVSGNGWITSCASVIYPIAADFLPFNLLPRNGQLSSKTFEGPFAQMAKSVVYILLISSFVDSNQLCNL